LTEEIQG